MRHNPAFASEDVEFVRKLVRANPWATLVSTKEGAPVASHYPVLIDEDSPALTLLTHLGRPDEEVLAIDDGEPALVIVQGHHGYISPSWYGPRETRVPTWNFTVAHLTGVPQVLSEEENLRVLTLLVEHFEKEVEHPAYLDQELGARVARGTVGLRIPVERFQLKRKLSQNYDLESRRNTIAALRAAGPYQHPELAEEMEQELARPAPPGSS